jgi:hypothetical protein
MASLKAKKQYSNIEDERDIEMYDVKSGRENDLNQSNDYEIARMDSILPDAEDSKVEEDRSGVDTETLDESVDLAEVEPKTNQTSDGW